MYSLLISYQLIVYHVFVTKEWFDYFKYLGNVWFYTGAILVSFSASSAALSSTFVPFFIGHLMWLGAGIKMKDKPIIYQNLFFVPLDIYAILIRL